ncbi:MAG: A/G-specific adenine glycosylase [Christensenellales bacterium]|jgi:A/G-specific adenine glycosylase
MSEYNKEQGGKDSGFQGFCGEGTVETLGDLVRPLLAWYDEGQRVLPWRSDPAPYAVWVSEVMLQQTRVETVLPYFKRFMQALPTIQALASASEQVLLKLWEGLGYYNRVYNLKRAAQIVMQEYGGELPDDIQRLRGLPGIGDYTAGAIASIAFQRPEPAVDGNVLRVVSRFCGAEADILDRKVRLIWARRLKSILPQERPGDFNQALMELGAMICLPGGLPRCGLCPIHDRCAAWERGATAVLPVRAAKKKRRTQKRTVFAVMADGGILLSRREAKGLLPGLYELPNVEGYLSAEEAGLWAELRGAQPEKIRQLPWARHVFSHVEWEMRGYRIDCSHFEPPEGLFWASWDEVEEIYALPSAFGAFLDACRQE